MIKRLRLRFRSVSFRAGLITSIMVGAVTGLFLFGFFALATIATSTDGSAAVRDATRAIEKGEPPAELWQEFVDDGTSVVAVFDDEGRVVNQKGFAPREVFDRLRDEEYRIGDSNWETGIVGVGADEWQLRNGQASDPQGNEYLIATATAPRSVTTSKLWFFVPAILTLGAAIPAGAIAAWTVRRSLRRVDQIQTEVQKISSLSLDRRLPTREVADPIDRLAHTMNDMLARLEAAHRQQSQFVADASHELRSPVAGLLAQLDVAQEYPDRVDVGQLLPRLHTETVRTQTLIEDLLYLSRLEGEVAQPASGLSLYEALEVVKSQVERLDVEHARVAISLDGCRRVLEVGNNGEVLSATEPQLTRVVQNLVDNASRHANERVKVALEVDPVGPQRRWLRLSVLDDGPGIPEADRQRVFDRFVRLDDARSRDAGGTGLGLAITRHLVAQMGGSITALRSLKVDVPGAHFLVHIPVKQPSSFLLQGTVN